MMLLCALGLAWQGTRGGHLVARDILLSVGSLGQDGRDMNGVERDIWAALDQNTELAARSSGTFGGAERARGEGTDTAALGGAAAHARCKCDCTSSPRLAMSTRETQLKQVDENVFVGPCTNCPCLHPPNIEATVAQLSKELAADVREEDALRSMEHEKLPVSIVFHSGTKGKTGRRGPIGFQGAEGPAGDRGPQGDTGARGDRGPPGPRGPNGFKGPDGGRGDVGPDG